MEPTATSSLTIAMSTPPIEIVVPVYLHQPSLYPIVQRCFDSLRVCYPDIPILGIDDGSPLTCPADWPIVARNPVNLGFTATVNRGLELTTADTIIIANDDLTFHHGDLDRYLTLPEKTIASPADTASSPDNRFGAIWGMRRSVYELLGGLNEELKHFFSDRDYYQRALAAGIEVIKWQDIVIDHIESATYKNIDKEALFAQDEAIFAAKK